MSTLTTDVQSPQQRAVSLLHFLSQIKDPKNRYAKLCFAPDFKDIALETDSSIYRTTISTVNSAAQMINHCTEKYGVSLPTGWNRELTSLLPFTQKIVEDLTSNSLVQNDIVIVSHAIDEAVEGLEILRQNHYLGNEDKSCVIQTAIASLQAARKMFEKKYSPVNALLEESLLSSQTKTQLTEIYQIKTTQEHLEYLQKLEKDFSEIVTSYQNEIQNLHKQLKEKDEEISRLKQQSYDKLLENLPEENDSPSEPSFAEDKFFIFEKKLKEFFSEFKKK